MSADGKLIFRRPLDGSGRLVFGDTGGGAEAPDAVISIDADLPGLDGYISLRAGTLLGSDALLPDLDAAVGLVWDANVSRGQAVHTAEQWQDGRRAARVAAEYWQDAARLAIVAQARWQDASARRGATADSWQDATRLRGHGADQWQDAAARRLQHAEHWQESTRLRRAVAAQWQVGTGQRLQLGVRWEESTHLRHAVAAQWQEASGRRRALFDVARHGRPQRVRHVARWEDARRPPPGVSKLRPPVEPPHLCYDPATLGRLVFRDPWSGDGRLVFRCWVHGPGPEPGATVVVPIRTVYMTTNQLTLVRADTGQPIDCDGFTLSIDADSWTWSWSASVRQQGLDLLLAAPGDDPREVIATINGVPYWLCAESIARERTFGRSGVRVQGRGRAAMLDAPYAPVLNHAADEARTAQQLMAQALQINGIGIGWDVAWGVTDWVVPGGTWAHQGTHISAVLDIASAAGAIVQPHRTAKTLRILPRYPAMPRDWGTLTPDFELPADVAALEGIEWLTRPAYNRVHVAGTTAAGVIGEYTRAGTAGEIVAPMVTHPLITHGDAARQRALPELANTGAQAAMQLRLPVLSETGLILPGSLVRYRDTTVAGHPARLGLVRGNALSWARPTLRQTLSLETHVGV